MHELLLDYAIAQETKVPTTKELPYLVESVLYTGIKKFVVVESFVASKFGYRGTVDTVFVDNYGQMLIGDWKTGDKYKRPEYWEDWKLQVSAYKQAVEETFGIKCVGAQIFYFYGNKNQEKYLTDVELSEYFAKFLERLELFNKTKGY